MPRLALLLGALLACAPRACVAPGFNAAGAGFNSAGYLVYAGSAAYHSGVTVRFLAR